MWGAWLIMAGFGFAEGLAVGTAVVGFLTVLNIVPRLARATGTVAGRRWFEAAITLGAFTGALTLALVTPARWPVWALAPIGALSGVFFGVFAAALAETLDVLPVLERRFGLMAARNLFTIAVVLGKSLGSLAYWLWIAE